MNTIIRMAELNISIEHIRELQQLKKEMFLYDGGDIDISVSVNEDDIISEREKTVAEYTAEGIIPPNYSDSETEFSAIYRKIADQLPNYDAIVFHGSAVAVNGKAYLFTAKSGTGKTTHTRLWLKNIDGAYVVNGDKPVIRMIDGVFCVCGTPWMGKECFGKNDCVPFSSIAILSRATENSVKQIGFRDAFIKMLEQTYRSPDKRILLKTLGLISEIGKKVKFYDLRCNMDDEAALISYSGMKD